MPEEKQILPVRMEKGGIRLETNLPVRSQMAIIDGAVSESRTGTAAGRRSGQTNKQRIVLLSDFSVDLPPQHNQVLQPKIRRIQVKQLPQSVTIAKESTEDQRELTSKKIKHQNSKIVLQQETQYLAPLSSHASLQPVLPQLIDDYLADLVRKLIRPILQRYSEPKVPILAKNLTYRDLGLESECTKFLSGLVRAEIGKQEWAELLTPAAVFRDPQIVIEGELWDDSDEIEVRLRILNPATGHEISTVDLSFHRKLVPEQVKIQPPSGDNLTIIQKIVELLKKYFPRGGEFQVGVWPGKGIDAVYVEGDKLVVYILPEKDAYLHVDYYQIDGNVVHLLPNKQENNFVKGGSSYIIGDPAGGGYQFIVNAPFGEEMLVVVASQKQLGILADGLIEPAAPYIKRLAKSLSRQEKKVLMAGSHYIILTKKRGSQHSKKESASTVK